jgi:hypothetical protein
LSFLKRPVYIYNYKHFKMKKIALRTSLYLSFCFHGTAMAQEGKWEIVKTTNKAPNCSECGFAAVNGKLYLIGGDGEGPKSV